MVHMGIASDLGERRTRDLHLQRESEKLLQESDYFHGSTASLKVGVRVIKGNDSDMRNDDISASCTSFDSHGWDLIDLS